MFVPVIFFCSIAGAFAQSSSSSSSLSSSSSSSNSQPLYDGPCPQIIADPIDYNRYSGSWYEVQRTADHYNEDSDHCHISTWEKPINNMARVTLRTFSPKFPAGKSYYANAVQNKRGTFLTHDSPVVGAPTDFYTLATDYNNYAIVWTCDNRGDKHFQRTWMFSRTPTPHSNFEDWKRRAFNRYNLPVPRTVISPNFVKCGYSSSSSSSA
ncbi:GSCOCG00013515001-RA-CDS [Cotesia congregata]|nr:GSCOCG00013515001-RA-CDS [Cotesia congregata]